MGRAVERVAITLALAWVSGVAVEAQAASWQGERPTARAEWARPDPCERLAAAKKKKAKGKKKVKAAPDIPEPTPAPAPEPTPAAGKNGTTTPAGGTGAAKPGTTSGAVLDLSDIKTDGGDAAAKQQLLKAPEQPKADDKKAKKGGGAGFDFGGGVSIDLGGGDAIDFGGDLGSFDVQINISSAERERVEKAMGMMTDEDYAKAALEFSYFLKDQKFAEFKQESEYQLAKALYKLGFLDGALKRFKTILEQGPSHVRYKKSVEWLFFISRKVADETPVLAELARFRNVTFPKAYRNEYRYLLSKYLFVQAQRFEADRLQLEQVARGKKSTDGIDFGALAEASKSDGFDFSKATSGGLDFSAVGGGESGGMDFGAVGSGGGGGMDFGGGSSGGGGMDFGAPAGGGKPSGGGGGGFDFGGGGADSKGGFDFGAQGGGAQGGGAQGGGAQMVREAAPQTAKEAAEQGLNLIGQVDKESKFFPRARYLEGLLAFFDGQDTKAVAAFQDVVRVLNPRAGARLDPKLREMAFLSLARIHYGHKQFDKSVYYYDQIDRDSENWLTALFEASWAYYRRGDFEKALGNLLTLHSPFFEREYFPESQMVKAIIYFEACRYAETRDIVDRFIDRFTAVMKAIDKIAQSQDAPELLYERIAQLQKEAALNQDDVTSRVVSLALNDSDIRTARKVVLQVNEQLELWRKSSESFRQSRLGEDLNTELKDGLAARTREAGEITRRKFEAELYALKGLLAQALRIKIEVARSERDSIEKKMRNEATGDELVPATARTVVDDEHVYWPYEGEYWRDELGTYELDFTQCRPLAAGGS